MPERDASKAWLVPAIKVNEAATATARIFNPLTVKTTLGICKLHKLVRRGEGLKTANMIQFRYTNRNRNLDDGKPIETTFIKGDGNCFYRCIALILLGDQDRCNEIREIVEGYIKGNWSDFKKYSEYVNHSELQDHVLCTDAKRYFEIRTTSPPRWAEAIDIFACATLFGVNIWTLVPNGVVKPYDWALYTAKKGNTTNECIYLLNKNGNHYEVICG